VGSSRWKVCDLGGSRGHLCFSRFYSKLASYNFEPSSKATMTQFLSRTLACFISSVTLGHSDTSALWTLSASKLSALGIANSATRFFTALQPIVTAQNTSTKNSSRYHRINCLNKTDISYLILRTIKVQTRLLTTIPSEGDSEDFYHPIISLSSDVRHAVSHDVSDR
jgi:hypothetical protein